MSFLGDRVVCPELGNVRRVYASPQSRRSAVQKSSGSRERMPYRTDMALNIGLPILLRKCKIINIMCTCDIDELVQV